MSKPNDSSISIESIIRSHRNKNMKHQPEKRKKCHNDTYEWVKKYVYLLVIILLIMSEAFTQTITARISNTMIGRDLTTWGYIIQATIIVLIYALSQYLVKINVL